MHSYRPSGAISGGGFLLLLILAVISGVAVGAVLWAVENYVHLYLVLVFPLLGGVIAGGVLSQAVKSSKIRSPLMAALAGIIAGLIMYGVYHGASYYLTFRNDLIRGLYIQDNPGTTPTDAELDTYMNDGLMRSVQDTGFVGYLKISAKVGFSVTRTSATSNETGVEIKDTAAYVYWAVEIALAALTAAVMAWNAAKEPFDENANQWYGPPLVTAIATTKNRKALVRALKDGSFQEAGALLTKQQIKYPRIEIWTRRSKDSADADVQVLIKHLQRQGRPSNIKTGMVSASDFNIIMKAVDATVDPNPVVSNI